ncbi:hypothetical protein LMG33818_000911 [Halomonadaceae bacterium LMG 33818]|uniref:hypothetical protein n=1 Tax=Cernens ardua TaxID=3402176 RepID=UPI003EDCAA96
MKEVISVFTDPIAALEEASYLYNERCIPQVIRRSPNGKYRVYDDDGKGQIENIVARINTRNFE